MVETDKRQKASFSEGNECQSPISKRGDETVVREEGREREEEEVNMNIRRENIEEDKTAAKDQCAEQKDGTKRTN